MGLVRRLSEMRRKQIVSHVDEHLLDDEEVLDWARTRHPETNSKGFVYITDDRFLVAWRDTPQETAVIDLSQLKAWGINQDDNQAPMLCVEGPEGALFIQFQTASKSMTDGARQFIKTLAELTPDSVGPSNPAKTFEQNTDLSIEPSRRSVGQHTRRVIATVIGLTFILTAPVIALLPGPWSILLSIAGLAVLASEYDWAEDALDWTRTRYRHARRRLKERRSGG